MREREKGTDLPKVIKLRTKLSATSVSIRVLVSRKTSRLSHYPKSKRIRMTSFIVEKH